eukprot:858766-Pyramimonas_sp.AAC.1
MMKSPKILYMSRVAQKASEPMASHGAMPQRPFNRPRGREGQGVRARFGRQNVGRRRSWRLGLGRRVQDGLVRIYESQHAGVKVGAFSLERSGWGSNPSRRPRR